MYRSLVPPVLRGAYTEEHLWLADFKERKVEMTKSYPQACVDNLWATPVEPGDDLGTTADELWTAKPPTTQDQLSGWASSPEPCGHKKNSSKSPNEAPRRPASPFKRPQGSHAMTGRYCSMPADGRSETAIRAGPEAHLRGGPATERGEADPTLKLHPARNVQTSRNRAGPEAHLRGGPATSEAKWLGRSGGRRRARSRRRTPRGGPFPKRSEGRGRSAAPARSEP